MYKLFTYSFFAVFAIFFFILTILAFKKDDLTQFYWFIILAMVCITSLYLSYLVNKYYEDTIVRSDSESTISTNDDAVSV